MTGTPWFTTSQYDFYECLSAMQKCIRRGDEDNALFFATELYLHGADCHAWSRLLIISVEDVADDGMHTRIAWLRRSWYDLEKGDRQDAGRLFFVRAVRILAAAPKSRATDEAGIVYCEGPRPRREIPDFAKDIHTRAGKELGRGYEHFFDEGAKVANGTGDDHYTAAAKKIRMGMHGEQREEVL